MKTSLSLISAFLLATLLSACTTTSPDSVALSRRVVFDSSVDTTGGTAGPLAADHSTIVIRTDAEWQALWYALHNNTATGDPPGIPAPPVDFSQEMIIGIGVGTRSNGCYGAQITDVADVDGHRVVVAKETSGDGCPGLVCTKTSVKPVLIVAVARTDEQVYFQWRAETICP